MKKYSTGLFVGHFAPLHSGHVFMIEESLKRCEDLYTVMLYSEDWVNEQPKELFKYVELSSLAMDYFTTVNYLNGSSVRIRPLLVLTSSTFSTEQIYRKCYDTIKKIYNVSPEAFFTSDYANIFWPEPIERIIISSDITTSSTQVRDMLLDRERREQNG